MRTKSPSYLTKNRLGIFIFQYRFPNSVQKNLPQQKILFRRTLKTRDKRLAERVISPGEGMKLSSYLRVVIKVRKIRISNWLNALQKI